MSFVTGYSLLDPRDLGEPRYGAEGFDMDIHGPKLKTITAAMQEQERIEERRRNRLYFDEPVPDAQSRLRSLIPKNNLRIPIKWFDFDSDAEKVFKAVARSHDVAVIRVSKTRISDCLCMLLDVVSRHRGLRMKTKGDPPRMSLQQRRDRHWQAVIDESSFARDFSIRLVRHVTLMLVGAHLTFAESKGSWNKNKDLNDKIIKVSEWLEENDPEDIKTFEYLQPERPEANTPRIRVKNIRKGNKTSRKRRAATMGPDSTGRTKRQRQTSIPSPPQPDRAEPPTASPRAELTLPPLPIPGPDDEVELPERLKESREGKRDWGERV